VTPIDQSGSAELVYQELREFCLPDLGEGLTDGEILRWLVKAGDEVSLNQPLVEVETAKAAVEIPSPHAGIVARLLHDEGEVVDVGAVIVVFGLGPAPAAPSTEPTQVAAEVHAIPPDAPEASPSPPSQPARDPVLVGYGVRPGALQRRARHPRPTADGARNRRKHSAGAAPSAKPPVRKLAKDLGVDLASVSGSGPDGHVTREDVRAAADAARVQRTPTAPAAHPAANAVVASPATQPAGGPPASTSTETRIPIRGVRKVTARAMVESAFTAPHVTLFTTVDVTPCLELLARLGQRREFVGQRLSPMLLVARALIVACRRNPEVNASWDEPAQEIVLHNSVNLGIAVASPRGLLVPNIKDASALDLVALAGALRDLAAQARAGETPPGDMRDGTITLTNIGSLGIDTGTPILNPGEAAILCFGVIREQPWLWQGEMVPRHITQLALSFDHRLVDGQLGAKVLADIGALLTDPTAFISWSH